MAKRTKKRKRGKKKARRRVVKRSVRRKSKKKTRKKKPVRRKKPKKSRLKRKKGNRRKAAKKKRKKKKKNRGRSRKTKKKKTRPANKPRLSTFVRPKKIESFDFSEGTRLGLKYEVVSKIGSGWEAEVYLIRERETGVERAAKIFFPHRNPRNKVLKFYAKKLHKLRNCPILIQYITQESFYYQGELITYLVSEYVEGEQLEEFLKRQPNRRLNGFQALHLLHALAKGLEEIHSAGEFHGDLHTENVILRRYGLGFDLKVLDLFHWVAPRSENIRDDVVFLIRLFYDVLGGGKAYPKLHPRIKEICCGLKTSLIHKRFKTAGHLRRYLETMEWG